MKFRIHFAPEGSFWCLQFSRLGWFWTTAMEHKSLGERTILRFDTFEQADAYVTERGIDAAYAHWVEPSIRAHLKAEQDAVEPALNLPSLVGARVPDDEIDITKFLTRGRTSEVST